MEEDYKALGKMWSKVIISFFWGIVMLIMVCLPETAGSLYIQYRTLGVIEKAIDKGLELRLNGDLLKGVELIKIEDSNTK